MTQSTENADRSPEAKGQKTRSETVYPYYPLGTAIEIVDAVRKAGGNEASTGAVMKAMGVDKPTDRRWAYGIPAATHFGLLERIGRGGDGRVKLTPLATRIVLPTNPEEARSAKVLAFKEPELYARLLERFAGHPVPPKDGLRNLLHREFGIVESMAGSAADAFLQSLKDAELVSAQNTIVGVGGDVKRAAPATEAKSNGATGGGVGSQTVSVPADYVIYRCKISGGLIIEIPLPPKFTRADVRRLTAFLSTQVDEDPEYVPPGTAAVEEDDFG